MLLDVSKFSGLEGRKLSRGVVLGFVGFTLCFWIFTSLPIGKPDFKNVDIAYYLHQGWNNYRFGEQHDRSFPGFDRKVAIEYFAASEKGFQAAVEREPDRPELYYDLENVFFKKEKYLKAVEAYQHAAFLNADDSDIRFNLNLAKK